MSEKRRSPQGSLKQGRTRVDTEDSRGRFGPRVTLCLGLGTPVHEPSVGRTSRCGRTCRYASESRSRDWRYLRGCEPFLWSVPWSLSPSHPSKARESVRRRSTPVNGFTISIGPRPFGKNSTSSVWCINNLLVLIQNLLVKSTRDKLYYRRIIWI